MWKNDVVTTRRRHNVKTTIFHFFHIFCSTELFTFHPKPRFPKTRDKYLRSMLDFLQTVDIWPFLHVTSHRISVIATGQPKTYCQIKLHGGTCNTQPKVPECWQRREMSKWMKTWQQWQFGTCQYKINELPNCTTKWVCALCGSEFVQRTKMVFK